MSLLVGWAITLRKASSEAPGGMRFRASGRARFRGSMDMLRIHTIGNSTVSGDHQADHLDQDLPAQRQAALLGPARLRAGAPSEGKPSGGGDDGHLVLLVSGLWGQSA